MMRWIVVDMDGTLLNSQKIITDLTKETIIDMQKSGYRLYWLLVDQHLECCNMQNN